MNLKDGFYQFGEVVIEIRGGRNVRQFKSWKEIQK